jgi:hypothetical protein
VVAQSRHGRGVAPHRCAVRVRGVHVWGVAGAPTMTRQEALSKIEFSQLTKLTDRIEMVMRSGPEGNMEQRNYISNIVYPLYHRLCAEIDRRRNMR